MKAALIKAAAVTSLMIGIYGSSTEPAYAASEDECAIWLCLPLSFVYSECNVAYSAMLDRIFSFPPKPPLPLFGSCSADAPDGGNFTHVRSQVGQCRDGDIDVGQIFDGSRDHFCYNQQTGFYAKEQLDRPHHFITVEIDGVVYDTFSFPEPDRNNIGDFTPATLPTPNPTPLPGGGQILNPNTQHN